MPNKLTEIKKNLEYYKKVNAPTGFVKDFEWLINRHEIMMPIVVAAVQICEKGYWVNDVMKKLLDAVDDFKK